MTRWVQALVAGRIVSPATFEQATTPVTLDDGRRGSYGFGFMLVPFRGLREVAHGGDISGFSTYFAIYPDERLAVVVLSNVGMRPPGPVEKQGRVELFAESETAFFAKEGPGVRVTFAAAPGGAAREAVLSLLGLREFRLRRLP
jgi:CubicO group peptidase (beta-lactamase class C family)